MTWQIMTWGLAQAGNRTSKTARRSQWWDSKPEWSADASGGENQHDWQLILNVWVEGLKNTANIFLLSEYQRLHPMLTIPSRPFGYDQV